MKLLFENQRAIMQQWPTAQISIVQSIRKNLSFAKCKIVEIIIQTIDRFILDHKNHKTNFITLSIMILLTRLKQIGSISFIFMLIMVGFQKTRWIMKQTYNDKKPDDSISINFNHMTVEIPFYEQLF